MFLKENPVSNKIKIINENQIQLFSIIGRIILKKKEIEEKSWVSSIKFPANTTITLDSWKSSWFMNHEYHKITKSWKRTEN